VSSALYELDSTSPPSVTAKVTYELEVWGDAWNTIPILGSNIALSSVKLDGEPAHLRDIDGYFTLLTNAPGRHRLEVSFFTHTTEHEGDVTLEFMAIPAAITETRLLLGTDAAAVSSPDAARVVLQSNEGQQEAYLALRPSETLQLHWRRPSQVSPPTPPTPPRIAAEIATQMRLSASLLEGATEVTFNLLRGATSEFTIELPEDLIVLDVSGAGMEWSLESHSDIQQLTLALVDAVSDTYAVTIRYERPLPDGTATVELPKIVALNVARQTGTIGISALRNTSVDIVDPTEGVSRTEPDSAIQLEADWEIVHAFRYNQPEYRLSVASATIEPRITVETDLSVSISRSTIQGHARLQYHILRGETRRLAFSLPLSTAVLSVDSPGMDWYAVDGSSEKRVEIELNEPVTETYTIEVALEHDLPTGDEPVLVPSLTVLDVARQSGWVTLEAAGNLKIDVGEGASGVTRIDPTELPAGAHTRGGGPILHAFEFHGAPFTLPVGVTRLDDVPVRVAAIDAVELTSVIADEMLITRARYWVRNNQRQFLRIDPGPDAEVWGAHVDGHPVSPAQDPSSDSGVLLRMSQSHGGVDGLGSFPMELFYMHRPTNARLGRRTLTMSAPKTDILADRMEWTIYIPEGDRIASYDGDLRASLTVRPSESPDRGVMTIGQPETIRRLREGIERFLITDINNPAGSATAQSKTFSDRKYDPEQSIEASARLAGVLPVHISLPQTGLPHRFERTLVAQGESLRLAITLRSEVLDRAWSAICGAVVLVLVLYQRFHSSSKRLLANSNVRRLVIGLLLGFLAAGLYQVPAQGAITSIVGALTGCVVAGGYRWWTQRAFQGSGGYIS